MNSEKALELGFADEIMKRENKETVEEAKEDEESKETEEEKKPPNNPKSMLYSSKAMGNVLLNKLEKHYKKKPVEEQVKIEEPVDTGRSVNEIMERLLIIKKFI